MSDTTAKVLSACRCGACHGPIGRVNLVMLRYRATWPRPYSSNVLTGYGPCAVAVCCDECLQSRRPIVEAVELPRDGAEPIYHPVESLEPMGPAPTHVLASRLGMPGIQCLVCGHATFDAGDVTNLYCAHCRAFHPIGG
jgi:hypothetical protein